jgi:hypothetical protein
MTDEQLATKVHTEAAVAHEVAGAVHQAVAEGLSTPEHAQAATVKAFEASEAATGSALVLNDAEIAAAAEELAAIAATEASDAVLLLDVGDEPDRIEIAACHRRAADAHRRAACEFCGLELG